MALDLRDHRCCVALSQRLRFGGTELHEGFGSHALAPTQSKPPFAITQAAVLAIFVLITLIAVIKFRPPTVMSACIEVMVMDSTKRRLNGAAETHFL
jgi:hypothetical protein